MLKLIFEGLQRERKRERGFFAEVNFRRFAEREREREVSEECIWGECERERFRRFAQRERERERERFRRSIFGGNVTAQFFRPKPKLHFLN